MPSMNKVSFADIRRMQDKIIVRQKQLLEMSAKRVVDALHRNLEQAGLSLEQFLPFLETAERGKRAPSKPGPKAKTAKPATVKRLPGKYANPNDAGVTWSGHGKQPVWFKDAIAAGVDPKSLLIRKSTKASKARPAAKKSNAAAKKVSKKTRTKRQTAPPAKAAG